MGDGDAVQRAAVDAAREFAVARGGFAQRGLGGDGDEGVEIAIEALDLAERFLHQLARGDPANAESGGESLQSRH